MERHFTVSGFVVEGDRTLLHWHPKLSVWLPPGGHIDPDEDPVQAVIREVLEETGITAEIVSHMPSYTFENVVQLAPPLSIIVADVPQGPHQHIDMVYALQEVAGAPRVAPEEDHGFISVTLEQLLRNEPLAIGGCGPEMPVVDDVRELGIVAIRTVMAAGA
jgi:8-oxo-dGTP pyrophosphatase MutT (NUDIX family)